MTDTLGNTVTTSSDPITLSFSSNPAGGTLTGTLTVNASSGSAKFTNIAVNKPGVNYRLAANATGLETAQSGFFSIVASGAISDGGLLQSSVLAPASRQRTRTHSGSMP